MKLPKIKISKQQLKVATAIIIPVGVAVQVFLEQRVIIKGLEHRASYYAEKLDSALRMLSPEDLEKLADEVDKDIEFFHLSQTTLKDVL
jgi:hypothetical protein